MKGVHAALHEVLGALRHESSIGSGRPPGVHHPCVYPQPLGTESHQNALLARSYETHSHSTTAQQKPMASASTQQPHPTFHPASPNLPTTSPTSTKFLSPTRFPTSLPPIRSHTIQYQSRVRHSQQSSSFPSTVLAFGSNMTSNDISDDEDASELPGAGLLAPLEVLRGLGEEHEPRAVSRLMLHFFPLTKFRSRPMPDPLPDVLVAHQ